jgi:hypothetical protein
MQAMDKRAPGRNGDKRGEMTKNQPQLAEDEELDKILLDLYLGKSFLPMIGSSKEIIAKQFANQALADAKAALLRREKRVRAQELDDFKPFYKGNHSQCIDKMSCIGYQNAQSDFDNEKALRLAQLRQQQEKNHVS